MGSDARYVANEPHVVAEHFGAETVIVNLDTGVYYNLRDSAHEIWCLMVDEGLSLPEVVAIFSSGYSESPEAIRPHVTAFVASLTREEMVVRKDDRAPSGSPADLFVASGTFAAPVLEIFSDLQDILLLDPVHDVDERGWPSARSPHDRTPPGN